MTNTTKEKVSTFSFVPNVHVGNADRCPKLEFVSERTDTFDFSDYSFSYLILSGSAPIDRLQFVEAHIVGPGRFQDDAGFFHRTVRIK